MANNKSRLNLVFLHHPLFLQQPDEPDSYFNFPIKIRAPLLDKLSKAGVNAIFSGHYHRNAVTIFQNGILHIVTSAIGRPLGTDPSGLRIVRLVESAKRISILHQYYGLDQIPVKPLTTT